jgi:hypothetical protein
MEEAEDGGGAMRENPMQLDMNDSDSDWVVWDADEEEDDGPRHNPIYCAYADNEPLEAILSLIEEDPTWVQEMDLEGWTLLHNLLNDFPRSTLPGVVRRVVEVWPESVREWSFEDTDLSLPLHTACSCRNAGDSDEEEFRSEAIRIIVEAWPGRSD